LDETQAAIGLASRDVARDCIRANRNDKRGYAEVKTHPSPRIESAYTGSFKLAQQLRATQLNAAETPVTP
jgi:hypothetical protein